MLAACCNCSSAIAQLQIVPDKQAQTVFTGDNRKVAAAFYNSSDTMFDDVIQTRMLQTSSATVMALPERLAQRLCAPPGEVVLESFVLNFPPVNAETRFLIEWLKNSNEIIGHTEVLVYPTNLLAELTALANNHPLGILDPQNKIKTLLKAAGVAFVDLARSDSREVAAPLVILGPFSSRTQMRAGLKDQVKSLAHNGTAVVWLHPPPEDPAPFEPCFYSILQNTNAVVIVQPGMIADLAQNPQSQLNLIHLCKLALHPQPAALPDWSALP